MAATYRNTTTTGEEYTYTVYAQYTVDEYQDGQKRFTNNARFNRTAVVKPDYPEVGDFAACFMDGYDDFYTSGYVTFRTRGDAERMAKAWVAQ